jgi:hypothetical protein
MPMSRKVAEAMVPRWRRRDMERGREGLKRVVDDVLDLFEALMSFGSDACDGLLIARS